MRTMTHNGIWKEHSAHLSLTVNSRVADPEHRKDILQDIYLKIGQKLDKIRKANNTGAYLTRLAQNAITDFFRKNQCICLPEQYLSSQPTEFVPVSERPSQMADCCLRPMIGSLPPIYRDALILTDLEGISQKELAERLGISVSGAKSRVQRARLKLKEVIGNCCEYTCDKWGNILECKPKKKCIFRE